MPISLPAGWYYPGEVAMRDAAGFLFLQGRAADAIHLATRRLFPQEIEDALTRHPYVAEAAVVGKPGPAGEEPVAFLVTRPGFSHADLAAHCLSVLAPDCRPKRLYYLDALPRTGNGKLDRPALQAEAVRQAALA
jgi:long-chain acyl-CoA synthetase